MFGAMNHPMRRGRQPQTLIEFNAGKMQLKSLDEERMECSADLRKGKVKLFQDESGLLHFTWENRKNNTVEEDFILFPGDGDFLKVNSGKESDRVFVLQYRNSHRRLMCWMQTKSEDFEAVDIDRAAKINRLINDPSYAQDLLRERREEESSNRISTGILGMDSLDSILGNLGFAQPPEEKQQETTTSTTTTTTTSGGQMQEEQEEGEQKAEEVSGTGALTMDQFDAAFQGLSRTAQNLPTPTSTTLNDVFSAEELLGSGLLDDEATVEALLPLLPESQQTREGLIENLQSPQFQQALFSLSQALSEGSNVQSIFSNFSLSLQDGMAELNRGDGVSAFLTAITRAARREAEEETANEEKDEGGEGGAMEEEGDEN
jgi:hypothetical protein